MVALSAGGSRLPWQRTPTTNPFLTNSKKSDGRNVLQTHINTYLSDGTRGDSGILVERDPLRSKDRGLFTYNIDITYINFIKFTSLDFSGPAGFQQQRDLNFFRIHCLCIKT